MLTAPARRSLPAPYGYGDDDTVTTARQLLHAGWSEAAIRAQLAARRWQRIGRAIIRHNGPLTREQACCAAVLVLGPRALLTSFTALARSGLQGWQRDHIHVLVPRGARVPRSIGLPLRVHYTDRWAAASLGRRGFGQATTWAALLAAAEFVQVRPACGLLAAAVQQRLLRPADLLTALENQPRLRHRKMLIAAVRDIAGGAAALSEIDFARLCRRNGLPEPVRQAIRSGPGGQRRYLDAEWTRRSDGRRVVAEVDGALHLIVQNWWADQLRQNEFAIDGDLVLRYPSVVLRAEEQYVVGQLRRALQL